MSSYSYVHNTVTTELYYNATGDAAKHKLLLLHGTGNNSNIFANLITELAQSCCVYALDLRGHGRSTHFNTEEAYQLAEYTRDIKNFINDVIREPIAILGHSLGGIIAFMLAATEPQLVRKIIIGDAPLSYASFMQQLSRVQAINAKLIAILQMDVKVRAAEITQFLITACHLDPIDNRELLQQASSMYATVDWQVINAVNNYRAFCTPFDDQILFPKITCPVSIIRADPDVNSLITTADCQQAQQLLTQTTVQVVETASVGHDLGLLELPGSSYMSVLGEVIQNFLAA